MVRDSRGSKNNEGDKIMILETYQNKIKRNERKKELQAQGYVVTVRSSSGDRLHPQYVTDYEGEYQTGFGNKDYLTSWGKLYHLEAREKI